MERAAHRQSGVLPFKLATTPAAPGLYPLLCSTQNLSGYGSALEVGNQTSCLRSLGCLNQEDKYSVRCSGIIFHGLHGLHPSVRVLCCVCVCSKFICVCLKCRIRQACHSVVGHPDSSSFVRPLVWCQTPSSEAPLEVGERFNGSPTRRLPHGQDACGLLLGTSPPSGFRVPWTAEEHVAGSHQSLHFSCTYSLQRLQLQSLGVSLVPDVIHMVNHGALLAGTFPIYHSAA